jgi:phosphoglycerate kinase
MIEKLITRIDELYIGGAMAFTFLKAQGKKVGSSLFEEGYLPHAKRILELAKERNVSLFLPTDFVLGKTISEPGNPKEASEIPDGFMGLDIGPKTIDRYCLELNKAKTIFWNGPMGLFEKPPYDRGTLEIAKYISKLNSIRVVGGGDSVAALAKAEVTDKIDHVSTGGGATLEFLEGVPLPGLESLAV